MQKRKGVKHSQTRVTLFYCLPKQWKGLRWCKTLPTSNYPACKDALSQAWRLYLIPQVQEQVLVFRLFPKHLIFLDLVVSGIDFLIIIGVE